MGRTVISDIPLSVDFGDTTMIVHQVTVTSPIVNNHPSIGIRSQRRSSCRIVQCSTIGLTMPRMATIDQVIDTVSFPTRTSFIEEMRFIGQLTVMDSPFDRKDILA